MLVRIANKLHNGAWNLDRTSRKICLVISRTSSHLHHRPKFRQLRQIPLSPTKTIKADPAPKWSRQRYRIPFATYRLQNTNRRGSTVHRVERFWPPGLHSQRCAFRKPPFDGNRTSCPYRQVLDSSASGHSAIKPNLHAFGPGPASHFFLYRQPGHQWRDRSRRSAKPGSRMKPSSSLDIPSQYGQWERAWPSRTSSSTKSSMSERIPHHMNGIS